MVPKICEENSSIRTRTGLILKMVDENDENKTVINSQSNSKEINGTGV
jgi:serine/threonine protein kinase